MNQNNDWKDAVEAVSAAELARLGEPPSDNDLIAFAHGDLTDDEETRVREYLVHAPELLDVWTAPIPPADAAAPILTETQLAEDWARLRAGIEPEPSWHVRNTWAVAASIAALVLAGLLFQSRTTNRKLSEQLNQPRANLDTRLLLPDGQRGDGTQGEPPVSLSPSSADFVLAPALINAPQYPDYGIELMDLTATPPRSVYSATGLRRHTDNTLTIFIPRAFLSSVRYRLIVYGLNGSRRDPLASYTLRVPRR